MAMKVWKRFDAVWVRLLTGSLIAGVIEVEREDAPEGYRATYGVRLENGNFRWVGPAGLQARHADPNSKAEQARRNLCLEVT